MQPIEKKKMAPVLSPVTRNEQPPIHANKKGGNEEAAGVLCPHTTRGEEHGYHDRVQNHKAG